MTSRRSKCYYQNGPDSSCALVSILLLLLMDLNVIISSSLVVFYFAVINAMALVQDLAVMQESIKQRMCTKKNVIYVNSRPTYMGHATG